MTAKSPPRRIGLLVDGWPAPAWQLRLLDELAGLAEVSVFAPPARDAPAAWQRLAQGVPALRRQTGSVRQVHRVQDVQRALAACDEADADLVIDATASPPSARHSGRQLWSLRQADGQAVAAPYAFLGDIASRTPSPAIALVQGGATVLKTVHPQVTRGQYAASLERLFGIAATLPAALLRMASHTPREWSPSPPARTLPPLAALGYAAWLRSRDKWRAWTVSESWMLGIIDKPIHAVRSEDLRSGVRWIGPWEPRRYWADPFGLPDDPGRLLCEEIAFDRPTGILKELTLDGDRITAEREVAMSVPGHLSYPYLFTWEGATYCIPESGAAAKVVIHRQQPGTRGWQPVCTALEGVQAGDATLFAQGGLLWIAYSDAAYGLQDSLCLAWAERIDGPWHRHPMNPVKIDVRSARPAGTPFLREGRMIRPAQDCSRTYGGAIALNRVDVCTPEAYAEETIEFIRPGLGTRNPDGLHTLSAWGDRTLVDAKREWVNPWVIRYKARRRLGLVRESPSARDAP